MATNAELAEQNKELTQQLKEATASKEAAEARLKQYEGDAAEVERRVAEIVADNDALRAENEQLRTLVDAPEAVAPHDPDAAPDLKDVTEDGLCAVHFPDGWQSPNAEPFDSVACEHGHFARKGNAKKRAEKDAEK